MRKLILIALAALSISALTLQSCNKIKDAIASGHSGDIHWDGDDLVINVPPVTDTNTHLYAGSFEMDVDSFINANNTSGLTINLGIIDTVKILSCNLSIQNPTTADNFQDFQLSALYFNTNVKTDQVTIGEIADNPDYYAYSLDLPVDPTVNLKAYLSDGKVTFNYVMGAKMRRHTSTTLQVKVHVTYDFHYAFK